MCATWAFSAPPTPTPGPELLREAEPSPAGPIPAEELAVLPAPPRVRWPRPIQVLWFGQRQETSWLTRQGWTPPIGTEGWRRLAEEVGQA